jgi:hypothetical protein
MTVLEIASTRLIVGCAVCFGDPNSSTIQSLIIAMAFLLFVLGGVLLVFCGTTVAWWRRSKRLLGKN